MSKDLKKQIDCPSSQATDEGARIFGVITGTPEQHRVGYLTETVPISEQVLALAGDAKPTELFRIAAPCAAQRRLQAFQGQHLQLWRNGSLQASPPS